jgi:hypothetical protein
MGLDSPETPDPGRSVFVMGREGPIRNAPSRSRMTSVFGGQRTWQVLLLARLDP